jgi:DNA-binding Lrp family transcriptional regulator
MTVSAFILVQTDVGRASAVAAAAAALPGVTESHELIGSYDVILKATAESLDELGPLVVSRIQMIEGITRTITCPIIHT